MRRGLKVALIVFAALTVACARVEPLHDAAQPASRNFEAGVLRLASTEEPISLNPLPLEGAIGEQVCDLIYSGLWMYDDRGALQPDVATIVPTIANGGISDQGRTVTIHLRRGVLWQDGAALTSRDVVFTYRAMMNPANIVTTRANVIAIASMGAPDAQTVVIHLHRPAATILMALSTMYMPILPAHLLERLPNLNRLPFNEHPVGSGPFEVVEWVHGDHLTFRANATFWRGPPKLKSIVMKIIPNPNTIITSLQSGDVDAWMRADLGQYPVLKGIHGYQARPVLQNRFATLDFNVKDTLLSDVRVRRAIATGIDRQRMLDTLIFGLGVLADADQPRASWAFDPNIQHVRYDPSAAGALLDGAGWKPGAGGVRVKDGKRLELQVAITPAPQEVSRIAALIQSELDAIGFDVTVKSYSQEKLYARAQYGGILYSGSYQSSIDYWIPNDDPDDVNGYGCEQLPPDGQNWNFWCDKRADVAMHDAAHTFDLSRRKRDYAVVQAEIASQLPAVYLWQADRVDVLSEHLQGYTPSFDSGGFWNAWQWSME